MKRKLVQKDLSRVKKFLEQMEITDKVVTFDLEEGEVFGHGTSADGEGKEPAAEFHSEEEVAAELARQTGLPQGTAHRYIQDCRPYFETDRNEITVSSYNLKLLEVLDRHFSQGFTVPQVTRRLREGEISVSMPDAPLSETERREGAPFQRTPPSSNDVAVEYARRYFASAPDTAFFTEEEEEEPSGRGRRGLKWGLIVLAPLALVAVLLGYQLGYLGAREAPPETPDPPPPPQMVSERADAGEEGVTGEEGDTGEPATVLPPEEVTVDVLNGCGVTGAAGRFADLLRDAGYQVTGVRDAASFAYVQSQIITRFEEREDGEEGIGEIRQLLPGAELRREEPAEDTPMVTVIIGRDDAG